MVKCITSLSIFVNFVQSGHSQNADKFNCDADDKSIF